MPMDLQYIHFCMAIALLFYISNYFCYSREQSLLRLGYKERCVKSLPPHHQKWLEGYKDDLAAFQRCIELNFDFIKLILPHACNIFENVLSDNPLHHSETEVGTLSEGLDKVQSVLKQLMRDWSNFGATERSQCYLPIIEEVERQFPAEGIDRSQINVLVPGAGLGRLAYEIATRGFACQGNEFNMFMLIVSFYVLNHCKNEFTIYPWIHQYCNNLSAAHQMTPVT